MTPVIHPWHIRWMASPAGQSWLSKINESKAHQSETGRPCHPQGGGGVSNLLQAWIHHRDWRECKWCQSAENKVCMEWIHSVCSTNHEREACIFHKRKLMNYPFFQYKELKRVDDWYTEIESLTFTNLYKVFIKAKFMATWMRSLWGEHCHIPLRKDVYILWDVYDSL